MAIPQTKRSRWPLLLISRVVCVHGPTLAKMRLPQSDPRPGGAHAQQGVDGQQFYMPVLGSGHFGFRRFPRLLQRSTLPPLKLPFDARLPLGKLGRHQQHTHQRRNTKQVQPIPRRVPDFGGLSGDLGRWWCGGGDHGGDSASVIRKQVELRLSAAQPVLTIVNVVSSLAVLGEQWSAVLSLIAQLFFDPQQLIVLGHAIAAGGGAGFNLPRGKCDR